MSPNGSAKLRLPIFKLVKVIKITFPSEGHPLFENGNKLDFIITIYYLYNIGYITTIIVTQYQAFFSTSHIQTTSI